MAGSPRNIKESVIVITGGGSGVGLECAKVYIEAGAKVFIVGRDAEKLKSACDLLGANSAYLAGTVTSSEFAETAMTKAKAQFGRGVDILVNNAGTILRKSAEDTSDAEWSELMSINVDGVFYFSRAFAKQAVNKGAIVNLSSTCGQVGAAGLAAYCASKGAVNQLTKTMALELAPRGITVNAVAPGAINSPMLYSKHADPKFSETVVERNIQSIPIGAVAEPEEIARAVIFLSREMHITGTILTIDGGYTAV